MRFDSRPLDYKKGSFHNKLGMTFMWIFIVLMFIQVIRLLVDSFQRFSVIANDGAEYISGGLVKTTFKLLITFELAIYIMLFPSLIKGRDGIGSSQFSLVSLIAGLIYADEWN